MSVYSHIQAGDFANKLEYPSKAVEPAVLRKRAGELTAEEALSLPAVKADYEAAVIAVKNARDAYNTETAELTEALKQALEEENGLVGNPKADKLWSKAWERGHSSGFSEVASVYNDLADLIV